MWWLRNLLRGLRKPPDYVTLLLSGEYSEYVPPPANFILRRLRPARPSLADLSAQFRTIAADRRVRGVVLHLRDLEMSQAGLESLAELIVELRAANKRVVCWASFYSASSYQLAAVTDEVLLQEDGWIDSLGISRTYSFLGEALEWVGLQADFLAIAPYKSAPDVFTRKDMSDEARQMATWLIDSAYQERIASIAAGREIERTEAEAIVDASPLSDLQALEVGAVDGLLSEEELPAHFAGENGPARLKSWEAARSTLQRLPPVRSGKYIALIPVEGTIVNGESGRPPIRLPIPVPIVMEPRAGDLTVVQAARAALADPRAAAVVVYVNSPGGVSSASEAMRSALARIEPAKPLIVSLGPVAASGGYLVATAGRRIFAQPSTITGSIGVFSGKLAAGGLLDRVLVGRETLSRGRHSQIFDLERPFSSEEREIVWSFVRRSYDVFVQAVAKSRKLTVEAVEAIGGGRVWTGRQALEKGLVDEIGGLDRAVSQARRLAGLPANAPVRLIQAGKRTIAPASSPATALTELLVGALPEPLLGTTLDYCLAGLRIFNRSKSLSMLLLVTE
ncbi:MAG: signal peptide peptidase SppA [Anaerolineales bacterium]